jgi:hypothetical protein
MTIEILKVRHDFNKLQDVVDSTVEGGEGEGGVQVGAKAGEIERKEEEARSAKIRKR